MKGRVSIRKRRTWRSPKWFAYSAAFSATETTDLSNRVAPARVASKLPETKAVPLAFFYRPEPVLAFLFTIQ
jgi:hypothetical protein